MALPIPAIQKDETEMPTTKLLLWQNSVISPAYHNEISTKVKDTFGIELPTREEELADLRYGQENNCGCSLPD